MIQSYIPVIKAKPNEFIALKNTPENRLKKLTPLFEVTDPKKTTRRYLSSTTPALDYLTDITNKISDVYKGKSVFIDGYQWFEETYDERGKHVLTSTIEALDNLTVNAIPVVGYDRWELPDYKLALCGLNRQSYLIRLDKDAIEDSYDPDYFSGRMQEILTDLKLPAANCDVMVDFADVSKMSVAEVLTNAENILNVLQSFGFKSYILSGCSIPVFITDIVKVKDSTKNIVRKEMLAWKALRKEGKFDNLLFSDYGVRGPNSAVNVMSPDTNGKIRYTVANECLISLGHSQRAPDKWGQMKEVSQRVINSGYFIDSSFSWGDEYISQCSQGLALTKGVNHWIAVDTNHHLAYVLSELHKHFEEEAIHVTTPF